MKKYLNPDEIPATGKTIHFHTSEIGGAQYTLTGVNPSQLLLERNGRFAALINLPTPNGRYSLDLCQYGFEFGANWAKAWLQPLPEAYSCPIRAAMARAYISQKALVYTEEVELGGSSNTLEGVAEIRWDRRECGVTGNPYYRVAEIRILPKRKAKAVQWVLDNIGQPSCTKQ